MGGDDHIGFQVWVAGQQRGLGRRLDVAANENPAPGVFHQKHFRLIVIRQGRIGRLIRGRPQGVDRGPRCRPIGGGDVVEFKSHFLYRLTQESSTRQRLGPVQKRPIGPNTADGHHGGDFRKAVEVVGIGVTEDHALQTVDPGLTEERQNDPLADIRRGLRAGIDQPGIAARQPQDDGLTGTDGQTGHLQSI